MKLTLTKDQIHDARDTLIWIRTGAQMSRLTGGFPKFAERTPGSNSFPHLSAWADALEDAIAEAERDVKPGNDADERAFWREVFIRTYDGTPNPGHASACADEALARYRAAFGGAK